MPPFASCTRWNMNPQRAQVRARGDARPTEFTERLSALDPYAGIAQRRWPVASGIEPGVSIDFHQSTSHHETKSLENCRHQLRSFPHGRPVADGRGASARRAGGNQRRKARPDAGSHRQTGRPARAQLYRLPRVPGEDEARRGHPLSGSVETWRVGEEGRSVRRAHHG